MRNIISIIMILSFTVIFLSATTDSPTNIEITVKSLDLDNSSLIRKLIDEFDRLNGVIHVECSMKTNTLMIIYDDSYNLSEENIKNIFSKWGCKGIDISYSLINWFWNACLKVNPLNDPNNPVIPPISNVAIKAPINPSIEKIPETLPMIISAPL